MPPWSLFRVTDAATEPVTTAEAKAHVRVDHSTDDTMIGTLITAARQWCEQHTRRSFITQTWRIKLDDFPDCDDIMLPRPPLLAVSSLAYIDGQGASQTWSSSNYVVSTDREPGRLSLAPQGEWPTAQDDRRDAVTITYTAGYGAAAAVPVPIKQAILLLLGHLYEHREAVTEGQAMTAVPMAVEALLSPYRVHYF